MGKRIKTKKIKKDINFFGYHFNYIILFLLFGVFTYFTGKYLGKRETFKLMIADKDAENKLYLLNKI